MNSCVNLLVLALLISSCINEPSESRNTPENNKSEIYSGPIIDMHIHAYTQNGGMFGLTHPPTLRGETYQGVKNIEEHKLATIAKFHEHNIVKAMVTDGQDWYNDFPELVLIANSREDTTTLKNQYETGKLQGIAEMSPFYAGILANDPSQMPYFKLAEELQIPVGFHVFPGGPNGGFHLMPEMLGGMRVYNASPLQLEDVLVKYPDIRLFIMHGGWPYVDDVKAMLYAHPNLYVDIAVVNWILPQEEFNNYAKSLIDAGFGNRILYGTDQMVWPDVISVGIETVNNSNILTFEQKEDIFFDNAAEFLGLDESEIETLKNNN